MKKKTVEKIKIASLKKELTTVKRDYKKSVDVFNDLMEQACKYDHDYPEEFPEGFIDAFVINVLSQYDRYKKHE